MKTLDINLMKHKQDQHDENYKIMIKEINDDTK